jgi:outer membrane protein TolC
MHSSRLALHSKAFLIGVGCCSLNTWAETSETSKKSVELSPQTIFENFAERNKRLENIQIRARAGEAPIATLQGIYDPEIGLSVGSEISRKQSLSGLTNLEDQTFTAGTQIRKLFASGTELSLGYNYSQQNSRLNPFNASLRPSELTENRFTLQARQNLLYNSMGAGHRFKIEAAEKTNTSLQLLAKEDSEELLLRTLRAFWDAYKTEQALSLSLDARKIYTDLLKSVQDKRRLGLADAGDLARAEANLEAQEQKVKARSAHYIDSLDLLFDLMDKKRPLGSEVSFRVPENIPAVPAQDRTEAENLRRIQIARSQLQSLEAERAAYKLEDLPLLDLIGEASWNGVDPSGSRSFSETLSARRPTYFLGVEFGFRFGNRGTRSKLGDLSNRYQVQRNELALAEREIELHQKSYDRQLSSAYQIAVSAQKARNSYRTLLRAQQRNYQQGRIDLSQLIQDYSILFDSELLALEALAQYHIMIHEWAALNDRLFAEKL